jgi:nitroreductase
MSTLSTSDLSPLAAVSRRPDHAVDRFFVDRWSPRALSGDEIDPEDLLIMFEAARWAPSSYNNQPWRMLYARRGTPEWDVFFNLLGDFNRSWAGNAGALVLFVSKTTFDFNGEPSITHAFDTGAAWMQLALQASLRGYVAHGMQGFDYARAKTELRIPQEYEVHAMVAIGRPGNPETLSPELREREKPSERRNLQQTICEGAWRLS